MTKPVIVAASLPAQAPVSTGQTLGTMQALYTPTSWSISSGNSSGWFAISSAGVVSLTSTGATGINALSADTEYDITVTASNKSGVSAGAAVRILAKHQSLVPVVTPASFTVNAPVTTGQTVGTISATRSPTSWAIASGNTSGYFALSNSGVLTLTSGGAIAINALSSTTGYNLTVTATNAAGTSSPASVAVTGIPQSSGAPDMSLQKNMAGQNLTFALINASNDAPMTGASVAVYVSIDGGAQTAGGGTVTECKVAGVGFGQYNYAPTQAETNGNCVSFLFSASGAVPENIMCLTGGLHRNVASQHVTFGLYSATNGGAVVGASPTIYVTNDGTQALGTGTVTGLGNGQYDYAPTQAETNGVNVSILATASGAVPQNISIWTVTP